MTKRSYLAQQMFEHVMRQQESGMTIAGYAAQAGISHDAAQDIAMFYSFFGTSKNNDLDPHLWLKYVMNNIQKTPPKDFKELLPQFINKELI